MKQCTLSRGTAQQTVWLPAQFAVKGRYLRIQDVNGWCVDAVYGAAPLLLTGNGRGFHQLFESIQ